MFVLNLCVVKFPRVCSSFIIQNFVSLISDVESKFAILYLIIRLNVNMSICIPVKTKNINIKF